MMRRQSKHVFPKSLLTAETQRFRQAPHNAEYMIHITPKIQICLYQQALHSVYLAIVDLDIPDCMIV